MIKAEKVDTFVNCVSSFSGVVLAAFDKVLTFAWRNDSGRSRDPIFIHFSHLQKESDASPRRIF